METRSPVAPRRFGPSPCPIRGRIRRTFSEGTPAVTAFQPPALAKAIAVSTAEPASSITDCTRSTPITAESPPTIA